MMHRLLWQRGRVQLGQALPKMALTCCSWQLPFSSHSHLCVACKLLEQFERLPPVLVSHVGWQPWERLAFHRVDNEPVAERSHGSCKYSAAADAVDCAEGMLTTIAWMAMGTVWPEWQEELAITQPFGLQRMRRRGERPRGSLQHPEAFDPQVL